MYPALFKSTEPDPVGTLLDTGYHRFEARNGLKGLCKFSHGRLGLLAVVNPTNTRGLLRESLREALLRYGFTPETEIGPDGVPTHGFRWDLRPHLDMPGGERCRACGQKLP